MWGKIRFMMWDKVLEDLIGANIVVCSSFLSTAISMSYSCGAWFFGLYAPRKTDHRSTSRDLPGYCVEGPVLLPPGRLGTNSNQPVVFDITKYGATDNGDISKAVLDAFKEECASTSPSTYQKAHLKWLNPKQLNGDLEWLIINYIDRFILSGGGIFDGQGKAAWARNNCKDSKSCGNLPNNLSFNFLTNSTIQDITSQDIKLFHVNVNGCKNLTFIRVNITAPLESINTDGIHVARSSNVNITDCVIGTGDDCISVGDELDQLHITRVTCGPGHGINVGSLGKTPGEKPVVGVYVKNCTFINTDNGVRVKTCPASHQGVVTDLHYEDIIVQMLPTLLSLIKSIALTINATKM
ncbi:hypothetical protein RND71_024790 [Anisodus tanguticus]|uniref:Uncharacterized protein n=1 Tax=Anisodus tanguticus TaxID=243964 RepID=A0AAE1RRC1_9SOLA|nr:hypothetical protein RND71_024790 [Anisodus tanguticus]